MSRLSASTYVEFHQATNRTFVPYMPIVVAGASLGGVLLSILSQGIHSLSGTLGIAGAACYAAVIAISYAHGRPDQQTGRRLVRSEPS